MYCADARIIFDIKIEQYVEKNRDASFFSVKFISKAHLKLSSGTVKSEHLKMLKTFDNINVFATVDIVRFCHSLYTIVKETRRLLIARPIFLDIALVVSGSDPFCHETEFAKYMRQTIEYKRILTDVPHARRGVRIVHLRNSKKAEHIEMPGFHDTFSIPGGGHVQSSLQTRRQNSDVRHCQRALLPDTNNTTLFLRLLSTSSTLLVLSTREFYLMRVDNSNQDLNILYY